MEKYKSQASNFKQIPNSIRLRRTNDRKFVWDLARRSLGGFGFLVIGYCL
jgi:hypothetical protein